MNLDRFDGYPDSKDRKKRPLTVLEMWQEMGYDPADAEQVNIFASRDELAAEILYVEGAIVAGPDDLPL